MEKIAKYIQASTKKLTETYTWTGYDDKSYKAKVTIEKDDDGDLSVTSDKYYNPKDKRWHQTLDTWNLWDVKDTFGSKLNHLKPYNWVGIN